MNDALLRSGPLVLLAITCLWLMLATGRTSSAIGHTAYGFGGSTRQRAAQRLFRLNFIGGLFGAAGYVIGLKWAVLHPMIDVSASLRLTGTGDSTSGITPDGDRAVEHGAAVARGCSGEGSGRAGHHRPVRHVPKPPVFLGMLMLALGLALALPSAVIVAYTVAFWLACEIQVRDEEMFLENAFGADYAAYRQLVRRWI